MAESKSKGAAARLNSPQERPREGQAVPFGASELIVALCQVDAILDGAASLLSSGSPAEQLVDLAGERVEAILRSVDENGLQGRDGALSEAVMQEMPAARDAALAAAPLHVTTQRADGLFQAIGITALTARSMAATACEAAGDTDAAEAIHGLQRLFEMIGALADSGVTPVNRTQGTLADWVCGRETSEAGTDAAPAQG